MRCIAYLLTWASYGRRYALHRDLRRASPNLRKLIWKVWNMHWRLRLCSPRSVWEAMNATEKQLAEVKEEK